MKKLLLILVAMTVCGMTMAQNVFSTGWHIDANGVKSAAVFKNGELVYETNLNSGSCESPSIAVDPVSGDVFYVRNSESYGDVFKNDAYFLNNYAGTHVNAISLDYGTLFSGGYKNISSVKTGVVWKNEDTTPLYTYGDGTGESEVLDVYNIDGHVIACGYMYESGTKMGCVWVDDELHVSIDDAEVKAVIVYDEEVYYVSVSNFKTTVWRENSALYTLHNEFQNVAYDIKVFGHDVYVTGYLGSTNVCVWKNGVELYNHAAGASGYLRAAVVNADGVYYVGCNSSQQGLVYKDGNVIYTLDQSSFYDLYVTEPTCNNADVRTLPYYEDFELGSTDWSCWTVTDENFNGDLLPVVSYWHLSGVAADVAPFEGNYCAAHRYNAENDQEGWLISPQIQLQGRGETTMKFRSYEKWPNDCEYEGVLVSTTGTNPSDFTEVWNGVEQATNEWKEITVDLSAYQGQTVYIAFKYTGQNGHNWYVDAIEIQSDYVPANQYTINVSSNNTAWGTVSGGGTFNEGASCTITATPKTGYQFLNWTKNGAEVSTNANYTFTVTENASFVANFVTPQVEIYTLVVTCDADQGTVIGGGSYAAGSIVSVYAIAKEGFVFEKWNDGNTDNPRQVTVNGNISLAALFKSAGVGESNMPVISVCPNPAKETIRLEGVEADAQVSIYNSLGMMVKNITLNAETEINVSDLAAGLYVIRCGKQVVRFVKE